MKALTLCVLLSVPAGVWAQTVDRDYKNAVAPGQQTSAWLDLQASGYVASPHVQSDTRATREKAAARWTKTYEFPIKESFYGDGFKPGE